MITSYESMMLTYIYKLVNMFILLKSYFKLWSSIIQNPYNFHGGYKCFLLVSYVVTYKKVEFLGSFWVSIVKVSKDLGRHGMIGSRYKKNITWGGVEGFKGDHLYVRIDFCVGVWTKETGSWKWKNGWDGGLKLKSTQSIHHL